VGATVGEEKCLLGAWIFWPGTGALNMEVQEHTDWWERLRFFNDWFEKTGRFPW
jgi:hypothetical protein